LLEQRRIVGSLRERTIFVPTPSRMPNPCETFVNERLERFGSRLLQYIEQSLSNCETSIEEEIERIDADNEAARVQPRERPRHKTHHPTWDRQTPQIVSRRPEVHSPAECKRQVKAGTDESRGGWSQWTIGDIRPW
jgi:hypothetical protein